jgi:hypothetical protein
MEHWDAITDILRKCGYVDVKTILIRIREELGLNLGPEPTILTDIYQLVS